MNTAVRALHPSETLQRPSLAFTIHQPGLGTLLLTILVLLSGLAVIYIADVNRRLAINLEASLNTQNQLHLDWGKLLLEQSTWSTQARIQGIAAQQMSMQTPTNNQVVLIKANA
jgi:cell division protein FtsL